MVQGRLNTPKSVDDPLPQLWQLPQLNADYPPQHNLIYKGLLTLQDLEGTRTNKLYTNIHPTYIRIYHGPIPYAVVT